MNGIYKTILIALIIPVAVILAVILVKLWIPSFYYNMWHQHPTNENMLKIASKMVKINLTPAFDFKFDIMKPGVLMHIDRQYTYDIVPPELLNGLLFQGIHRTPVGTSMKLKLFSPAKIYFFFHHVVDGGYSEIFKGLKCWKPCALAPQYDIHNGDHGLKMLMFKFEAEAGTYSIPPTTKDRACFGIVFKSSIP